MVVALGKKLTAATLAKGLKAADATYSTAACKQICVFIDEFGERTKGNSLYTTKGAFDIPSIIRDFKEETLDDIAKKYGHGLTEDEVKEFVERNTTCWQMTDGKLLYVAF